MTKAINLSNLERYNNKLKPLVVTDAEVVDNDLQLKYLDNETKTVSLPEAPKAVSDAEISNNEIQLTFTDSDTKTLELPESPKAVSDAEISGNDLQLTFTDSDTKTLELPEAPKAVADAEISGNDLQLTFTDSDTKTLELPGASFPTRTVTRIPTYIEIHFQLGVFNDGFLQINEKLNIPLSMAKDIIKFYTRNSNTYSPLGAIKVTDVTATKANNQYDTVYLAAVNCNPKECYDLSYSAYLVLETSFGDFNLQTAPLMESIEEAASQAGDPAPTYPETIPAQVTAHSESELFQTAGTGWGGNSGANYYVYRAVLVTENFNRGDNADWSNQNISINGNRASVHFDLIFEDAQYEGTPVTFTETVIE